MNATRVRQLEIAIASIGVTLVAVGVGANQRWLDRHFLPSFFLPRHWYVVIETAVRAAMVGVGSVLTAWRMRVARIVGLAPRTALLVLVAIGLALACSEAVLRLVHIRPTEWL